MLVIISVDPQTSHRASEAARIALGLVASENRVTIVLLGHAAKVLDPWAEDWVDGEDLARHLATLRKLGQAFHVDADAIRAGAGSAPGVAVVSLSRDDLATLIANSDRILCF